ncbi:hypothetical protein C3L33_17228, partial [Rhododendron williamsianum]
MSSLVSISLFVAFKAFVSLLYYVILRHLRLLSIDWRYIVKNLSFRERGTNVFGGVKYNEAVLVSDLTVVSQLEVGHLINAQRGFRKIDTDRWEFSNNQFIKGQKHLLKNICRRKQPQVVVQRKSSRQKDKVVEAFEEDANSKLWEDVESLKTDKNALTQELVKLRQHQQTSQTNLVVLKEQLKGMEKNQQQLLSFIVMAMQSPGFLVQLLQPKENNWRMAETGKTVLKRVIDDIEPVPSDGMIVRYQPPMAQSPDPLSLPTLDSENLELGLSSDEVRDLLMNIDYTPGPMDEKLLSPESNWPMVIPELPDHIMDGESNWPMVIPELPDHIMDQMLLSSTLSENKEDGDCDTEELPNYGMEIEFTSLEDSNYLVVENQDMDILTEMIGLLASECNIKHQSNF